MARTNTLGNFLTDVAGAIRTKKGSEEPIAAADFDTEIENLPSGGGDLSEYFNNTITENRTSATRFEFMKKLPDITVDNNVTSLKYLFYNFVINGKTQQPAVPKVVGGNNVTDMSYMYAASNDTYLTSVDLTGLNTSNVTDMSNMFSNRRGITQLDFNNFDFSNITAVYNMFYNCTNLLEINLSNFTGKKLTDSGFGINSTFDVCINVKKIDLSNFEPVEAIDTRNAFASCYKLEELYLDKWDLATKVRSSYSSAMFSNCGSNLADGAVTKVYVKDQAAQNWVLTATNGHSSSWTTDNVIIAGSEADLRNA